MGFDQDNINIEVTDEQYALKILGTPSGKPKKNCSQGDGSPRSESRQLPTNFPLKRIMKIRRKAPRLPPTVKELLPQIATPSHIDLTRLLLRTILKISVPKHPLWSLHQDRHQRLRSWIL